MKRHEIRKLGGPGSGNWGHAGRPGNRGGSLPRSSAMSIRTGKDWKTRQAAAKVPEGWSTDKYGNIQRVGGGVRAVISPVGDQFELSVTKGERRIVNMYPSRDEAIKESESHFGATWEKNMFGHYTAQEGDKNAGIRPPSKAQYREGYELRLGKGGGRGDEWVKLDHISREYSSLKVAQQVAQQFFRGDEGFVHHQTALNMMRNAELPEQRKM